MCHKIVPADNYGRGIYSQKSQLGISQQNPFTRIYCLSELISNVLFYNILLAVISQFKIVPAGAASMGRMLNGGGYNMLFGRYNKTIRMLLEMCGCLWSQMALTV